jgi:hypothetical protein
VGGLRLEPVAGESLESITRLEVIEGTGRMDSLRWTIRGVRSNERYVTRVTSRSSPGGTTERRPAHDFDSAVEKEGRAVLRGRPLRGPSLQTP